MSINNIHTIIKSFLSSVSGKCSCSINLNTNFGNMEILGDKYNRLISKVLEYYPKMQNNFKTTYINGNDLSNHIFEIYKQEVN